MPLSVRTYITETYELLPSCSCVTTSGTTSPLLSSQAEA